MDSSALPHVSRETNERLRHFADLLLRWTKRINLIAKSTTDDVWNRHILDSAQVIDHAPAFTSWVDIGSGGGLPGVVSAVIAAEKVPDASFTLIESDMRKATFLRTVSRELEVPFDVIADRIEAAPPQQADVLSARALSSLSDLMPMALRHLSPNGTALFMKGRRFQEEIAALHGDWAYEMTEHPSMTDADARILSFKRISRAA